MKPLEILRKLKKTPQKSYGQYFLVDERAVEHILTTVKLGRTNSVVEIGPGLGVLTRELVKQAKHVVAIEADRALAEYLRRQNWPNLVVVTGNALQIDWTVSLTEPYQIVANIPYSITTPLLQKIFQLELKPEQAVLLLQKEAAERLSAKPSDTRRNLLSVLAEACAEVKIVKTISRGSFYPVPGVDSAIVELKFLATPMTRTIFWPAVAAGFRHSRQTLLNGLKELHLDRSKLKQIFNKLKISPLARPTDLTLEQWQQFSQALQRLTTFPTRN
jgi:16S rRNA (adenine1518-N6/adenine1519-N6)-dimethyltransferase